jgi:transcriptional regulator with XRE-family HTH domain
MPSLHVLFGQIVRRFRSDAGYSQESFADLIGVHRNYIGTVERGETNITLENIARIARGLKQPIWMLLRELETPGASRSADITAAPASRDASGYEGPGTVRAGRVAERRAEVHAQLADLLREMKTLEKIGAKRPPSRAKRPKK